MFVELLQKGVRTAYRTLGAREIGHRGSQGYVHGFRFDVLGRRKRRSDGTHTIVFLHGLGDASTTWLRQVRPLREHATVLTLDLPPFGLSRLYDGHFLDPREHAGLVAGLIQDHLDQGGSGTEVTLVGQSMGGWVAQWIVHDHPELVDRVALVSTAGARLEGSREAVELLTASSVDQGLAYLDSLWYKPLHTRELIVKMMLDRLKRPSIRGFLEAMGEQHTLTEAQLGTIETPVLVIWGAADGLLDPRTPAWLAQHWGAPVERTYLARAGHMPHLERPRAVTRRLRSFAGL